MSLHTIPRESTSEYFWVIGNKECSVCETKRYMSEHHKCATKVFNNSNVFFCECSTCIEKLLSRHYFVADPDGDYICSNCLNDNHPTVGGY